MGTKNIYIDLKFSLLSSPQNLIMDIEYEFKQLQLTEAENFEAQINNPIPQNIV